VIKHEYQRILLLLGGMYFLSTLLKVGKLLLFWLSAWRISLPVELQILVGLLLLSSLRLSILLSLKWV